MRAEAVEEVGREVGGEDRDAVEAVEGGDTVGAGEVLVAGAGQTGGLGAVSSAHSQ